MPGGAAEGCYTRWLCNKLTVDYVVFQASVHLDQHWWAVDHMWTLRSNSFVQILDIINEELEAIWGGQKTAQQGLDDAAVRGNKLLRKFERANK